MNFTPRFDRGVLIFGGAMAQIAPQQAGRVNAVAFPDMLAWSEDTDNGKQPTKDRGYDVIVGGQLFKSYADHPRVLVDLPKLKIQSTAAGRYQLLPRCYDAYKKAPGLKDLSPLSQGIMVGTAITDQIIAAFAKGTTFAGMRVETRPWTSSIIQDPERVMYPVTIPWRGFLH